MKDWNPFEIFKFEFSNDGWFLSCLIPKQTAVCPCCAGQLIANADEWEKSDNGDFWMPTHLTLDCENMFDEEICPSDSLANRMPYVYWLPLSTNSEAWVKKRLEIYYGIRPIPQKWAEKNGQLKLPFTSRQDQAQI